MQCLCYGLAHTKLCLSPTSLQRPSVFDMALTVTPSLVQIISLLDVFVLSPSVSQATHVAISSQVCCCNAKLGNGSHIASEIQSQSEHEDASELSHCGDLMSSENQGRHDICTLLHLLLVLSIFLHSRFTYVPIFNVYSVTHSLHLFFIFVSCW